MGVGLWISASHCQHSNSRQSEIQAPDAPSILAKRSMWHSSKYGSRPRVSVDYTLPLLADGVSPSHSPSIPHRTFWHPDALTRCKMHLLSRYGIQYLSTCSRRATVRTPSYPVEHRRCQHTFYPAAQRRSRGKTEHSICVYYRRHTSMHTLNAPYI